MSSPTRITGTDVVDLALTVLDALADGRLDSDEWVDIAQAAKRAVLGNDPAEALRVAVDRLREALARARQPKPERLRLRAQRYAAKASELLEHAAELEAA